jgi:hypothetical protein
MYSPAISSSEKGGYMKGRILEKRDYSAKYGRSLREV